MTISLLVIDWEFSKPAVYLSITSLALAIANFSFTKKKTTEEAQRSQVIALINVLAQRCENLAEEVIRHITWQGGRLRAPEIYRLERECSSALEALKAFFDQTRRNEMDAMFAGLYKATMGEGFPVTNRKGAEKPGCGRCILIQTTKQNVATSLNQLRVSATTMKIAGINSSNA